eukprot:COSAG01_NODE_52603_length_345_cov_1.256098_1_plen_51_part_10
MSANKESLLEGGPPAGGAPQQPVVVQAQQPQMVRAAALPRPQLHTVAPSSY